MVADDYAALLSRLYAARRFGAVLELGRMVEVLDALGHPERDVGRIIHIGGTNGKGSTTAFCEALAIGAGVRVAAFSSPHLSHLAERFRIGGEPLGQDAIVSAARRVEAADIGARLTFFERITAMALCAFAEARVDLCVLEVGLGGRFDATNAVDSGVAVVTGIALDHTEQLGDSLESIATEKAGIFRAGKPAVIGRSGEPEIVDRLAQMARDLGCDPVVVVGDADIAALSPIALGLPGRYQRANAAAALAACRAISVPARPSDLGAARLAGRLETLAVDPRIVVDGAHNGHAARTLVDELGDAPLVAVIGVSAGKDVAAIAGPIAARARVVVATRSRQDRAVAAQVVAEAIEGPVQVVPRVGDAIDRARDLAHSGDVIAVAGSLFVAAEAREHLLAVRPDPVRLADPAAIAGSSK